VIAKPAIKATVFGVQGDPGTATPLLATVLIVTITLVLALVAPFLRLAEATSIATLVVFAAVNSALIRLRLRRVHIPAPHFRVPLWVPVAGLVTTLAMIAGAFLG
jgi:APA family basic amino acid/polyamine antiporter